MQTILEIIHNRLASDEVKNLKYDDAACYSIGSHLSLKIDPELKQTGMAYQVTLYSATYDHSRVWYFRSYQEMQERREELITRRCLAGLLKQIIESRQTETNTLIGMLTNLVE